jgi:hypothetical protein
MLNFIAGFIVGALACQAIITYHNWRQRQKDGGSDY